MFEDPVCAIALTNLEIGLPADELIGISKIRIKQAEMKAKVFL